MNELLSHERNCLTREHNPRIPTNLFRADHSNVTEIRLYNRNIFLPSLDFLLLTKILLHDVIQWKHSNSDVTTFFRFCAFVHYTLRFPGPFLGFHPLLCPFMRHNMPFIWTNLIYCNKMMSFIFRNISLLCKMSHEMHKTRMHQLFML